VTRLRTKTSSSQLQVRIVEYSLSILTSARRPDVPWLDRSVSRCLDRSIWSARKSQTVDAQMKSPSDLSMKAFFQSSCQFAGKALIVAISSSLCRIYAATSALVDRECPLNVALYEFFHEGTFRYPLLHETSVRSENYSEEEIFVSKNDK
jgi:hypothetical protein